MENMTLSDYFNFTVFVNMGYYRYPAFAFCLLLYSLIVTANIVIILVIYQQKTLHEPMYVFISFLSFNALYGSAGFFPRVLMDILSDTHLISRPACFIQIYVIYTYASYEATILSIMAYDRYIAVCHPLHYHSKMTNKTVLKLAAFAWISPAFSMVTVVYLAVQLPLCGSRIAKLFCATWNVAKLSCVSTVLNNIVGLLVAICTLFLPLCFVLYTYLQIILVCKKASVEFRTKVFHSCLPHIITFVMYIITTFSDIALSRFNVEELSPILAVLLSLEFVMIPPVLNPLVYGLKLPEIRKHIFKLLSW